MQAIMETLFDIVYLSTVITLGILLIKGSRGRKQYLLYGIMAVTLGCGDAFHLVPRAIALCTTGLDTYVVSLGIGKLVTSVTMTIFYVLLYYVWRARYSITGRKGITFAVYALSIARVALCLMPQNMWTSADAPLSWGIYRNIPFALLGVLIIVLYYNSAKSQNDKPFRWLWLTIVLSFGFYIPVVLFADAIPLMGTLMIPKTCAYVWTVAIGYCAMKGDKNKMKKYLNFSLGYAIAAMIGGVFYREFTKLNGFVGATALGKVHTHLFLLGMVMFLLIALFAAHSKLEEQKQFRIFMVVYNVGVPLTAVMLMVRGIAQVLNLNLSAGFSAAISGIAGIAHILTVFGIVLLILLLKKTAKD